MRFKLLVALAFGAIVAPSASFAGWGAIACDVRGTGACGVSYGWATQALGNAKAIQYCQAGGYQCYLYNWEHNMCIHGLNGSYTCN
jgi:hypothetical protein